MQCNEKNYNFVAESWYFLIKNVSSSISHFIQYGGIKPYSKPLYQSKINFINGGRALHARKD
jgi:hypothetical protein